MHAFLPRRQWAKQHARDLHQFIRHVAFWYIASSFSIYLNEICTRGIRSTNILIGIIFVAAGNFLSVYPVLLHFYIFLCHVSTADFANAFNIYMHRVTLRYAYIYVNEHPSNYIHKYIHIHTYIHTKRDYFIALIHAYIQFNSQL
jgi:hypothetical protein